MKIEVTFRNFDHTEAIDGIIKRKSEKLKKYVSGTTHLTWNCYIDSDGQVCEVNVSGFKGADITAKSKSSSLYKSVDQVVHKLERQLKKKRSMQRSRSTKGRKQFTEIEAS